MGGGMAEAVARFGTSRWRAAQRDVPCAVAAPFAGRGVSGRPLARSGGGRPGARAPREVGNDLVSGLVKRKGARVFRSLEGEPLCGAWRIGTSAGAKRWRTSRSQSAARDRE